MTGFHKYTIFVFVVLVNFTPLFNLFGGPLSFHHAIDVQRLCRVWFWQFSGQTESKGRRKITGL